jgi:hypothetical protein
MNEIKTARATQAQNQDRAIVLASAPVSYGAFEITVGIDPNVPDGLSVLDQVAEAGYRGFRPRRRSRRRIKSPIVATLPHGGSEPWLHSD